MIEMSQQQQQTLHLNSPLGQQQQQQHNHNILLHVGLQTASHGNHLPHPQMAHKRSAAMGGGVATMSGMGLVGGPLGSDGLRPSKVSKYGKQ